MRVFQHYKGGLYEFLHEGYLEENHRQVVVYRALNSGNVYVRPAVEWHQILVNGAPRFKLLWEV